MSASTPRKSFESLDSSATSPAVRSPGSSLNPRSQYPFPRHDSHTRPSQRARRGSTASIANSIGGRLDSAASNTPQTVNELAHNAIANLNSPPIVRTGLVAHSSLATSSSYRAPSTRDIPPVTLINIPQADTSIFRPYLAQVGPLYETFQRARAASEEASAALRGRRDSSREDEFAASFRRGQRSSSQSSQEPTSPAVLSPPASPAARRPSSSGGSKRRKSILNPTPLSTIPNVYFEEDFHLENPRTFDIVSERSEVIPPSTRDEPSAPNGSAKAPSGRKALHTNAILQEKLSWYMDTVEVHLIQSIATASTSFFAALSSLKELQSEAEDCIEKIKSLRDALQQLDSEMAIGGLEIVNQDRRRENLRILAQAVNQLCTVVEEAKSCEELVDRGELDEASMRIDDLECLIAGEQPLHSQNDDGVRIDLRDLKVLGGFSEGILALRTRIGRAFEAKFIDALLSDIRQHIQRVPAKDTMQRWANATFRNKPDHNRRLDNPAYMSTNESLRPELLTALAGLSRAGHTSRATAAYRDAIMREIKSLIRKHLPSSSDDDLESTTSIATSRGSKKLNPQEKSAILARNLRALDPQDAEDLLVKVYTNVGEALRRLGVQVKVLLDVTLTIDSPRTEKKNPLSLDRSSQTELQTQTPAGQTRDIREEVTEALDLSSLLGQAVDTVYAQVTKILRVRTEQSSRLPLEEFLRYFVLNRMFADECEAISSRSGDALKGLVVEQMKDFVQHFAEAHRQGINQTLEEDKWDAKDFSEAENKVLTRVLESVNRTPSEWIDYTSLWKQPENPPTKNGNTITNGDSSEKTRTAVIDEQRYVLVNADIAALHGIETFLKLMVGIPTLTTEACNRLLEYLRFFNSRCCQLILGAGATRSAGLKNITTKHLALASQACSFIVALLPYLREFVRRQAPTSAGNLLLEFDKVKRLFQDHQISIHDKLVEIMSGRCNAHINAMRKLNFDALGAESAEAGPNAYVEALCKETSTLHRVLGRHLPEVELLMVMTPIFTFYKTEWSKALNELAINTDAGKQRLSTDIQFLDTRLSKLDGSGDLGPNLVKLVKDKPTSSSNSNSNSGATPQQQQQKGSTEAVRASVDILGKGQVSTDSVSKDKEKEQGGNEGEK